MKKLSVLLAVLLLVSGFAIAQEEEAAEEDDFVWEYYYAEDEDIETVQARQIETWSMEVNIGFPVHWTNGIHENELPLGDITYMSDKFVTANTAIGLSVNYNISRIFGFIFDIDIFYGARLTGFSEPSSDYNSLSGMNILVGPVWYLYNNNILRIPLALGLHMYSFTDELWVPMLSPTPTPPPATPPPATPPPGQWVRRTDFQLGLGIYLGVQFHFNNDIYLFSRTNAAVDFIRVHTLRNNTLSPDNPEWSHSDLRVSWGIKPTIGVGMKFPPRSK